MLQQQCSSSLEGTCDSSTFVICMNKGSSRLVVVSKRWQLRKLWRKIIWFILFIRSWFEEAFPIIFAAWLGSSSVQLTSPKTRPNTPTTWRDNQPAKRSSEGTLLAPTQNMTFSRRRMGLVKRPCSTSWRPTPFTTGKWGTAKARPLSSASFWCR